MRKWTWYRWQALFREKLLVCSKLGQKRWESHRVTHLAETCSKTASLALCHCVVAPPYRQVVMQDGSGDSAQRLQCIWRNCEEQQLYSCVGCAYAIAGDTNEPLCLACWDVVHAPGTSCGGQQQEFMTPRGCGVKGCEASAAHFCYDCHQHTCSRCSAIKHSASTAPHRVIETIPGPAAALKGMCNRCYDKLPIAQTPCNCLRKRALLCFQRPQVPSIYSGEACSDMATYT